MAALSIPLEGKVYPRQRARAGLDGLTQALVPHRHAPHLLDAVVAQERLRDGPYDVVQTRAEPAAGDNGGDDIFRLEPEVFTRPCADPLVVRVLLVLGQVEVYDVQQRLVGGHEIYMI